MQIVANCGPRGGRSSPPARCDSWTRQWRARGRCALSAYAAPFRPACKGAQRGLAFGPGPRRWSINGFSQAPLAARCRSGVRVADSKTARPALPGAGRA